ncbi:hypothetical protein CRYUN_Cryun03dG0008800 [Craigia yunnanensis]
MTILIEKPELESQTECQKHVEETNELVLDGGFPVPKSLSDLGKVLLLPKFGGLPQWAVVGDTFPVGCAFDEANIHHKYFKENPDYNNPAYNTKNGVYSQSCGLENVMISWGHDDYLYLVAKENGTTLPSAGLFIIRYHSLYPLHKEEAYMHLLNEEDEQNLKWLRIFKSPADAAHQPVSTPYPTAASHQWPTPFAVAIP